MRIPCDDDAIEAAREIVPRVLEREIPVETRRVRGVCVLASRVGRDALRYFGIDSKARTFNVLAGNLEWAEWIESDGADVSPMPEEAWSVAITPESPEDGPGLAAHVILDLGGEILDLDSGQLARPERRIFVPPTVRLPIERDRRGRETAWTSLPEGGVLIYVQPDRRVQFTGSPDWKRGGGLSGTVIREMRDVLSASPTAG